jgi:hypothetical protein
MIFVYKIKLYEYINNVTALGRSWVVSPVSGVMSWKFRWHDLKKYGWVLYNFFFHVIYESSPRLFHRERLKICKFYGAFQEGTSNMADPPITEKFFFAIIKFTLIRN